MSTSKREPARTLPELRARLKPVSVPKRASAPLVEEITKDRKALDARQGELEALEQRLVDHEAGLRRKEADLAEREARLGMRVKDLDTRAEGLDQREGDLQTRADTLQHNTRELEGGLQALATREEAVGDREVDFAVREATLVDREREVDARRAQIAAAPATAPVAEPTVHYGLQIGKNVVPIRGMLLVGRSNLKGLEKGSPQAESYRVVNPRKYRDAFEGLLRRVLKRPQGPMCTFHAAVKYSAETKERIAQIEGFGLRWPEHSEILTEDVMKRLFECQAMLEVPDKPETRDISRIHALIECKEGDGGPKLVIHSLSSMDSLVVNGTRQDRTEEPIELKHNDTLSFEEDSKGREILFYVNRVSQEGGA